MRLKELTAVVTGGASGMGESMCYALAHSRDIADFQYTVASRV